MKQTLSGLVILLVFVFGGCAKPSEEKRSFSGEDSVKSRSAHSKPINENPQQPTASGENKAKDVQQFQPFSVYSNDGSANNHYSASGFMPDGKCLSMDDAWQGNCHGDKTCIKINYDIQCSKEGKKWAGIYWLHPANNWGNQKGGFNLTGAQKLTFWAKGEKGGERIEEFKIGGITGEYPDSDSAVIGPVILTPEWTQYTIDLRGKDLSYISGGFAWSTKAEVNPNGVNFYIDDVQYE